MARTPKARALGAALRQAREDKSMYLREVGAAINKDIGVLSRWENGERTPKPEQVAQILATLGITGDRYDEIMTLAYGTAESQWVATTLPEQRQQMVAYQDWEQNATRIVAVAPLLIPGLLQTADYIEAIMTAGGVPPGEIAARINTRIGRRQAIDRRKPAELLVLLGECALNQDIGGRHVMIEQLNHLRAMAGHSNIELRVVPSHRGWHPALEGAFSLINSRRDTVDASIVFVETRRSVLMLHEDADVAAYRDAIDRIIKISLHPESSAAFLADLAKRMEKHGGTRSHLAEVKS
jgi:transcriptional regulator with XRE-family HTH domain